VLQSEEVRKQDEVEEAKKVEELRAEEVKEVCGNCGRGCGSCYDDGES